MNYNVNWEFYSLSSGSRFSAGTCSEVFNSSSSVLQDGRLNWFDNKSNLNLLLLNVRSITSVIDEIGLILIRKKVDVMAQCETWLDDSICDSEVCPPGFSIYRNDRNRRGGGVTIIVSSRVRFVPRPDLSVGNIESLWIELFQKSKRSMFIGCVYRSPSSTISFFDHLSSETERALSVRSQNLTILGDLNCNLLTLVSPATKALLSFCNHFGLEDIVCSPTRITETSTTLIDVILTNRVDCYKNTVSFPFGASDHNFVTSSLHARGLKSRKRHSYVRCRDYRNFDPIRISEVLTEEDLDEIVSFDDVDLCVFCFNTVVTSIIDLAAPFKCRRVKQVFHPWSLSPEALKARYLRDKCHRLALHLQSSDAWANNRHLRNKATTILRRCKADYFSTLADDKMF